MGKTKGREPLGCTPGAHRSQKPRRETKRGRGGTGTTAEEIRSPYAVTARVQEWGTGRTQGAHLGSGQAHVLRGLRLAGRLIQCPLGQGYRVRDKEVRGEVDPTTYADREVVAYLPGLLGGRHRGAGDLAVLSRPVCPEGGISAGHAAAGLLRERKSVASLETCPHMGMDSEKLSKRTKQPGHDRTFLVSEANFVDQARACLDAALYDVEPNPNDLKFCFATKEEGGLGLNPEASITSKRTGRKFFVEVKKQGPAGNAEERACKHHTVQFYKLMESLYSYDYHPYVTICCENLAVDRRYTAKFVHLFEPENYFLWVDYDPDSLCAYLRGRCSAWLDDR